MTNERSATRDSRPSANNDNRIQNPRPATPRPPALSAGGTPNPRRTAATVGALYIVGTVAGVVSVLLSGDLATPDGLAGAVRNEGRSIVGILMILVMAFALAMVPVVLFPVLRRYGESLALGAVVFRGALETCGYLIVALCMFGALAAGADAAAGSEALVAVLQDGIGRAGDIMSLTFAAGALMIYWLFFISRLVPRWLSVWGLAGGVLYFASAVAGLTGLDGFDALTAPLAVQEMAMALWLIVRGFDATRLAAASAR